MKRTIKLLLLTVLGTWMAGSAWALDQDADGVYQIGSAQDLADFANKVNESRQYGLNAVLTADIDFTSNSEMIGVEGKPYNGTFDGQGHKVTVAYNTTESETALFRRTNGATIKNLAVTGTITTTGQFAGGIVSGIWETTTLENCIADVDISDSGSGDGTHGGIVARISNKNQILIKNCAFTGTLNAPNREGSGGIIGWPDNGGTAVKIQNCLVIGTITLKQGSNNDIIVRNSATVTNTYFFDQQNLNNQNGGIQTTTAIASSGELCWWLNESQADTPHWYQEIGTDATPSPIGTAVVYSNGDLNCDGSSKGTATYGNTNSSNRDPHMFEGGICISCKKELVKEGDYYQLGCADALIRFAEIVNGGEGASNAVLTADIDMTGKGWTPIGQDMRDFAGHFNGQNHSIKNLVINNSSYNNQALFGQVVGTAVIENVIMDASCSIKGNEHVAGILARVWGNGAQVKNCKNYAAIEAAGSYAGGIVGSTNRSITISGCVNYGTVKGGNRVAGILGSIWDTDGIVVEKCGNEGTITGTGANAGGIVGCSEKKVDILNCYSIANVTGGNESAALCGWMGSGNSSVKNCYSTATVSGLDGSYYLYRKTDITASNNYQLTGMPGTQGTAFTTEQKESGWLAYHLNGSSSTDVVWYQVIPTDLYPVPFGEAIVYLNGDLNCDGTSKGTDSYSNTAGSNQDSHQFANGFCSVCDSYDPDYMTASSGYYEVTDGVQLRWTAVHSQEATNAGIKVKLMNDIDMDGIAFDGFGSNLSEDNRFKGEIDGQRHKIFNLKMNADRQGVGLVNTATVGALIQNLTMASSCDIKGTSAVAAFIGAVRGSSGDLFIKNCGNEGAVTASGANGGGFIGCKYDDNVIPNFTNCYNVGVIHSGNDGGSFSGWMPKAKLTNCYSIVDPAEKDGNGVSYGFEQGKQFARGGDIQLNNCYDFGTGDWGQNNGSWGSVFEKDKGKIAEVNETEMGRVFAGLFDAEGGNVWRMEYDGWAHPVLYDPANLVL